MFVRIVCYSFLLWCRTFVSRSRCQPHHSVSYNISVRRGNGLTARYWLWTKATKTYTDERIPYAKWQHVFHCRAVAFRLHFTSFLRSSHFRFGCVFVSHSLCSQNLDTFHMTDYQMLTNQHQESFFTSFFFFFLCLCPLSPSLLRHRFSHNSLMSLFEFFFQPFFFMLFIFGSGSFLFFIFYREPIFSSSLVCFRIWVLKIFEFLPDIQQSTYLIWLFLLLLWFLSVERQAIANERQSGPNETFICTMLFIGAELNHIDFWS